MITKTYLICFYLLHFLVVELLHDAKLSIFQHKCVVSNINTLTLSQTTNFRFFQTERVCRRQFQFWWKWQKLPWTGWKHCGKRRNCSSRAISPFPTVFSNDLYCTHVKTRACLGWVKRFPECSKLITTNVMLVLIRLHLILFVRSRKRGWAVKNKEEQEREQQREEEEQDQEQKKKNKTKAIRKKKKMMMMMKKKKKNNVKKKKKD